MWLASLEFVVSVSIVLSLFICSKEVSSFVFSIGSSVCFSSCPLTSFWFETLLSLIESFVRKSSIRLLLSNQVFSYGKGYIYESENYYLMNWEMLSRSSVSIYISLYHSVYSLLLAFTLRMFSYYFTVIYAIVKLQQEG